MYGIGCTCSLESMSIFNDPISFTITSILIVILFFLLLLIIIRIKTKRLHTLETIILKNELGVLMRISENRALLALLEKETPELIRKFPWVVVWIRSQDAYLCSLASCCHEATLNKTPPYPETNKV